jgi:pyruvate ferredoxin oxidoreductase beta subunit
MKLFECGHRACAGCAEPIAVRAILEVLGKDVIVVNPTGCLEIVSSCYPESAWGVPYIHSLFENGPAVASGIARALRAKGNGHTRVVCIGGDGSFYDIGFGSFSGALERNEDVIFVCLDTECYSNTGVQRSGATSHFAATTTSPVGKIHRGKREPRKHIGLISAAHNIPYAASASVGNIFDLKRKVEKAKNVRGSSFIFIHTPCNVGWRFPPNLTIEVAKLAIETGAWKLYEFENGKLTLNYEPKFIPVEEYLKLQGRFKHLTKEEIEMIQKEIIYDWNALKVMERIGKGENKEE